MDLRLPVYLCLQRAAVKHLHIDSGRKISFHFLFSTMNVGSPGAESEFANHFILFLLLWGSGLSWTNATHKIRYVVCMYQLLGAIGFAALMLKGAGKKSERLRKRREAQSGIIFIPYSATRGFLKTIHGMSAQIRLYKPPDGFRILAGGVRA